MKKVIITIILVLTIIFISTSIVSKESSTEGELKIGLSLPLTGDVAFLGEPAQKAAKLALRNAGETKYQYKLIFEDDQFDPAKTVTTLSKLINVDKVSSVITFGSGTGNAANKIAEQNMVPHFALASDPTILNGEYNYIHWTPAFSEGELLVDEMVKRGYKKVAILNANHPGAFAVTNAVKERVKDTDIEIVYETNINLDERDLRSVIQTMRESDPDIVLLELFSPVIEIAKRQMNEAGLNYPVTSVEAIEWSGEKSLFEGEWFVSDSYNQKFIDLYEAEYGEAPQSGSQYIYDLVSLLIKIQEESDKILNAQEIQQKIQALDSYKSEVFGDVPIDDEGYFTTKASVKMIENGEVIVVE